MRRLVVGPWVGEFGWELCCWQGFARTLAKDFDEVICISRTGHEELYADFCDEFLCYDPATQQALNATAPDFKYDDFHAKYLTADSYWMKPAAYQCNGFPAWAGEFYMDGHPIEQTFRKYGRYDSSKAYDLIIHKRHRLDWKNWPLENVQEVASYFLSRGWKVACVGSTRESLAIEGCTNLRGIPLSELADVLASSRLILGSSSGVMHFASLCGCPHLVISAPGNKHRYETAWNPFGTQAIVMTEEGWKASSESVIQRVNQFISSKK